MGGKRSQRQKEGRTQKRDYRLMSKKPRRQVYLGDSELRSNRACPARKGGRKSEKATVSEENLHLVYWQQKLISQMQKGGIPLAHDGLPEGNNDCPLQNRAVNYAHRERARRPIDE